MKNFELTPNFCSKSSNFYPQAKKETFHLVANSGDYVSPFLRVKPSLSRAINSSTKRTPFSSSIWSFKNGKNKDGDRFEVGHKKMKLDCDSFNFTAQLSSSSHNQQPTMTAVPTTPATAVTNQSYANYLATRKSQRQTKFLDQHSNKYLSKINPQKESSFRTELNFSSTFPLILSENPETKNVKKEIKTDEDVDYRESRSSPSKFLRNGFYSSLQRMSKERRFGIIYTPRPFYIEPQKRHREVSKRPHSHVEESTAVVNYSTAPEGSSSTLQKIKRHISPLDESTVVNYSKTPGRLSSPNKIKVPHSPVGNYSKSPGRLSSSNKIEGPDSPVENYSKSPGKSSSPNKIKVPHSPVVNYSTTHSKSSSHNKSKVPHSPVGNSSTAPSKSSSHKIKVPHSPVVNHSTTPGRLSSPNKIKGPHSPVGNYSTPGRLSSTPNKLFVCGKTQGLVRAREEKRLSLPLTITLRKPNFDGDFKEKLESKTATDAIKIKNEKAEYILTAKLCSTVEF